MNLRFRAWVLQFLVYWLEAERPDQRLWLPPIRLMALIFGIQGLVALWIMGAFRILGDG